MSINNQIRKLSSRYGLTVRLRLMSFWLLALLFFWPFANDNFIYFTARHCKFTISLSSEVTGCVGQYWMWLFWQFPSLYFSTDLGFSLFWFLNVSKAKKNFKSWTICHAIALASHTIDSRLISMPGRRRKWFYVSRENLDLKHYRIRLSWIIETFLKFPIHVSYDLIGWNVSYDQQSFVHDGICARLSILKC